MQIFHPPVVVHPDGSIAVARPDTVRPQTTAAAAQAFRERIDSEIEARGAALLTPTSLSRLGKELASACDPKPATDVEQGASGVDSTTLAENLRAHLQTRLDAENARYVREYASGTRSLQLAALAPAIGAGTAYTNIIGGRIRADWTPANIGVPLGAVLTGVSYVMPTSYAGLLLHIRRSIALGVRNVPQAWRTNRRIASARTLLTRLPQPPPRANNIPMREVTIPAEPPSPRGDATP